MGNQGWIKGRAHAAGETRRFKLWAPSSVDTSKPAPLLMLLHGCTHTAEAMATISGMNEVAETHQFLVLYPEQRRRANLMKCWNWFNPKHQSRNMGEPAILAATIELVCASHTIDPDRIYVAGISAGGAMAVIMAACYPDVFAGLAVCAGVEFKSAVNISSAFQVMKSGGPDPITQGQAAFEAMKDGLARKSRQRMPVICFHGTADMRVNPMNAKQIIAQWSKTNSCLAAQNGRNGFAVSEKVSRSAVPNGRTYQRYVYTDQNDDLLMERWMIEGMGHSWPGSPHPHQYGDPKAPRASEEIWRFFAESRSRSREAPAASQVTSVD
jgi:poly(hydroxyalkanoate) depolymerase family esterase